MKKQMIILCLFASNLYKPTQSTWKDGLIITGLTAFATRIYTTLSIATKIKISSETVKKACPIDDTVKPKTPFRSGWKISRYYTLPALMGGGTLGLRCLGHNGKSWRQVAWMIPAAFAVIGATETLVGSIMYNLKKRRLKANGCTPHEIKRQSKNAAIYSAIDSAHRISSAIVIGSLAERGIKYLRDN